jgi:hypothetical protein
MMLQLTTAYRKAINGTLSTPARETDIHANIILDNIREVLAQAVSHR